MMHYYFFYVYKFHSNRIFYRNNVKLIKFILFQCNTIYLMFRIINIDFLKVNKLKLKLS